MHIQIYTPDGKPQPWLDGFAQALPGARLSVWTQGAAHDADYAVVWQPPADMLRGRADLRAVFNLGAGVDAILGLLAQSPDALPESVPIVRLDDAGMASQMSEYVTHAVLRFFRRLDEYERLQQAKIWRFLKPFDRDAFVVGVLGLGVLGTHIARTLAGFGFPVRGWSRSAKSVEGIDCRAGADALPGFLAGTRVLINVLPLTADTENVLDAALFDQARSRRVSRQRGARQAPGRGRPARGRRARADRRRGARRLPHRAAARRSSLLDRTAHPHHAAHLGADAARGQHCPDRAQDPRAGSRRADRRHRRSATRLLR